MNKNKISSLLVNAEPFGYGPSSAIAECFPKIREKFNYLAYAGGTHTLDLQSTLPYNKIIRLEGTSSATDESFKKIVQEFDGFLTALDFHYAELAIEVGVPCVIYDPLTWFWRKIPSVISHPNVLYLAQGFHGVQDIFKNKKEYFRNARVVPPLVKRNHLVCEKNLVMVNLGGLMNPFWSLTDCIHYATTVVEAVSDVFRTTEDELIVLGNKQLEEALPNHGIISCSREEMKELLPHTKLVIATSGLGNIYESSAYNIPTLFLPPPGDSHGQQLQILIEHREVDEFIDWHHLDDSMQVDYHAVQVQVMQQIAKNIEALSSSTHLKNVLFRLVQEKCNILSQQSSSRTSQLLNQFGENGATEIAQLAHTFIQSKKER